MSAKASVNVKVIHRFNAEPGKVFDAWLDTAMISQFMFGPKLRDEQIIRISLEPRVGGIFSFVVRRQGEEINHVGEYLEIERPERLAFTWGTDDVADRSRVIIDIERLPSGCQLTLKHELDANWADYAPRVEASWSKMLDALATELK